MSRDDKELDLSLFVDKRQINRERAEREIEELGYDSFNNEKEKRNVNRHSKKQGKKSRKKKSKVKRVALIVYSFLMIYIAITLAVVFLVPGGKNWFLSSCGGSLLKCFVSEDTYNNIFDSGFSKADVTVNSGIDKEKFEGYYTVALFGIDSRDESMDAGVNSDSIIIVSINQDTGEVVMSSVFRDTWLNIPGIREEYGKVNSAYCKGGVRVAINTLNTNLDLEISDYITINFSGLATIIDMMGGLDLNISESEAHYINHYLWETKLITGMDAEDVTQWGNVHLNGIQVTAFCRIRYCEFIDANGVRYVDDMGRTARQRYVLSLMIDKAKQLGVSKIMDIANEVLEGEDELIRTSIPYDEMMEMLPTFINFKLGETRGFPFTYDYPDKSLTDETSAVGVGGLEYNVSKLHEFLYKDSGYVPTQTVKTISRRLMEITGVGEIHLKEDR